MIHQFQPCSLVCGDLEVGEYPGRVTEVERKCAVDCLRTKNARCTIEECVSLASSTLHADCAMWYVLLVGWCCWKGQPLSLLAKSTLATVVSTLGRWKMFAQIILWHHCIHTYPLRGMWWSRLRGLGSVYLPSSLTRLRAYHRYIWRWSSRWVTSTCHIVGVYTEA